jgi:hypothetical protein
LDSDPKLLLSSARKPDDISLRSYDVGFRLVLAADDGKIPVEISPPTAPASVSALTPSAKTTTLAVSLEDNASLPVEIKLRVQKSYAQSESEKSTPVPPSKIRLNYNEFRLLTSSKPGNIQLNLANFEDGTYYLTASHEAYARCNTVIHLKDGVPQEANLIQKLYRKRAVTIHYVINKNGGRDFTPANIIEGDATLTDDQYLPNQTDIWLSQRKSFTTPSDTPTLAFGIRRGKTGFVIPPGQQKFADLAEAPESGYLSQDSMEAVAGRSLYFLTGNNNTLRYGKLTIIKIEDLRRCK